MSGNTLGRLFRVTTFGESHGPAVGAVVDGCPPGLPLSVDDIQLELDRRRPGQSDLTTQRREADRAEILSGVHQGLTLGTPICVVVRNTDARPRDYGVFREVYRPGHADFTYAQKYRVPLPTGGGRASARETVGRVAAGAIARLWLRQAYGTEVIAWVESVGKLRADIDPDTVTRALVESNPVRCPAPVVAGQIADLIRQTKREGDSLGGVVGFAARNVPAGLGEPVFAKLDGELGRGMLSIPAVKGVELGSGFSGTELPGSTHNDPLRSRDGAVIQETNNAGGVLGGITTGATVYGRVAFKPTATIRKPQSTVQSDGSETVLEGRGRHDPCVLPRAVPIVEAMAALILADLALRDLALQGSRRPLASGNEA